MRHPVRHVLLTRPQEDSEKLAERLAAHGIDGVIEPMLVLKPTLSLPPSGINPQVIMLTSAHALRFLDGLSHEVAKLLALPCFCVGSSTTDAAQRFGFTDVHNADGDGLGLSTIIQKTLTPNAGSMLHIAGEDIDSTARDELQKNGFSVDAWTTYRAETVTEFSPILLRMMKEDRISVVLFYSSRTAETFKTLMQKHGLENTYKNMIALGISEKVLSALADHPWQKRISAATPTEEALLQCLLSESEHE